MKQNGMICKTLLLVAMMGFSLMSNAQRYETDHGRVYFGEEMLMQADAHSFVDLGCGYAKDRHHVYMNGRILEFVDPATFRLKEPGTWRHRDKKTDEPEVSRGYYKSKWNVYYGDKKLDAMPSGFKELGGGYAKDHFNVFYYGEKVKGAMASSFKYMGNGYAEDSFDTYYRGRKLK